MAPSISTLLTSSKKTIAIIGAGVSGLQAARTILSHPNADLYNVMVFEARDRIGGRVDTKRTWGFPLDYGIPSGKEGTDVGANFIHGTRENPINDIAETVGSTFVDAFVLKEYFDGDGKAVSQETAGLLERKGWEYWEAASVYSRENEVDKDISLEDFCRSQLNNDKDVNDNVTKALLRSSIHLIGVISACELDNLSLKYFWMENDLPGDVPLIDSTYEAIIQYIAQPALSKKSIKFNTQICSIEINSTKPNSIALTSTAKEAFYADSVIVTIPLGCLHSNAIKFTPSLPDRIQEAISNIGFGVLEKLFLHFSEPWWLLPTDDVQSICIDSYRFPALSSIAKHFPEERLGFYSLARTNHPRPVLAVFIANKLARYLVSQSKTDLKTMLQTNYIPMLPNYDAKNPACQILNVDSSAWSQDELSGFGSYSHIPVGSETGDQNMKVLSERILPAGENGGVWFAGEHTADTEIIDGLKYTTMATVTGAYKSGERAGNHVIHAYNN